MLTLGQRIIALGALIFLFVLSFFMMGALALIAGPLFIAMAIQLFRM